ncbi:MAG TPA: hypothetical protein VFL57_01445 [Bryobacteraceae bacterium]|nr:hypothetical protein [Bryobacteraceae bacterium]
MHAAAGPRVVELSGKLHELAMPAVCINCGGTASQRFHIEKIFEHEHDESPTTFSLRRIAVPFCPLCLDTHRRELRVVPPLARIRMMYNSGAMWTATVLAIIAVVLLTRGGMLPIAIAAFLLLVAAVCALIAFYQTRYLAVPPATSVSSAFGFGGEVSGMFEPERRVLTLRNAQFAEAFVAVNHERIWDPASPQAQHAATKRSFATAVFVVIAIAAVAWGIYDEYFSD